MMPASRWPVSCAARFAMNKAVLSFVVFLHSYACALSFITTDRPNLKHGEVCRRVGGVEWTCQALRDCPTAHQMLHKRLRPQLCNFTEHPEVCCEPDLTSRAAPPNAVKRKTNEIMCYRYAGSVFIRMDDPLNGNYSSYDSCSLVDPVILNVKQSEPREFPHMALIGHRGLDSIQWKCGGALISDRIVIMAAHCPEADEYEQTLVRLGEYHVESRRDDHAGLAQPVDYEVAERINHPRFKRPIKYNDIALLKLAKRVTFNEYIRPVCLYNSQMLMKSYAISTGWGSSAAAESSSTVILKHNVTMVPMTECARAYEGAPQLPQGVQSATMMCAQSGVSDSRACQSDRGGPLQLRMDAPYCMYSLIGIRSFRAGCSKNKPEVFTQISPFIPWIESIAWP